VLQADAPEVDRSPVDVEFFEGLTARDPAGVS
jgi:hypothetical protein